MSLAGMTARRVRKLTAWLGAVALLLLIMAGIWAVAAVLAPGVPGPEVLTP